MLQHESTQFWSRHGRSFGVLVLAAAVVLLDGAVPLRAQSGAVWSGTPALLGAGMSGRSTQGYLGIDLRDVSEDQIGPLKLKEARGAEVVGVDHDGPACKAGLQVHDVILQMNGQVVEGEEQLRRMQIAREVRNIRERTGLSQPQFAARYRIALGRLRDFEQARSEPDVVVRVFYRLILEDPDRAEILIRQVEQTGV